MMSCNEEDEGPSASRRSSSQPITIIQRDPKELDSYSIYEEQELAYMYEQRTWAMFDRIMERRQKHPLLPPCYHDIYSQTTPPFATTSNNNGNAELCSTFHEGSLPLGRIDNNYVDNDDEIDEEQADRNGEVFDFEM